MGDTYTGWELYERLVAQLIANQLSTSYCVTPNARLRGNHSGRSRQIDVLIDARHDTDNENRIIIDAKRRTRKIDVTDVEAFKGLMEDVRATHGYLVSSAGHTAAAEKRAQKCVSLRILPLEYLADFDPSTWPICTEEKCNRGRVFWDGYHAIDLTLKSLSRESVCKLERIHYVGKCDKCSMFYVKCMECGDVLPIPISGTNDFGHQCCCRPPWFWLGSIEEDGQGNNSAELHCISGIGRIQTVSRRSL